MVLANAWNEDIGPQALLVYERVPPQFTTLKVIWSHPICPYPHALSAFSTYNTASSSWDQLRTHKSMMLRYKSRCFWPHGWGGDLCVTIGRFMAAWFYLSLTGNPSLVWFPLIHMVTHLALILLAKERPIWELTMNLVVTFITNPPSSNEWVLPRL